MKLNETQTQCLWEFARGDADLPQFEAWLYSEVTLEAKIGQDLYLQLIECDYADQEAVRNCRYALWVILQKHKKCECYAIRHVDHIFLKGPGKNNFVYWNYTRWDETQIPQTWPDDGKVWEYVSMCKICDTKWLVFKHPRSVESTRLERFANKFF